MDDNMKKMREKLVQELERGKESATQIRNIIHNHNHHDHRDECFKLGQLDAHSSLVLTSFANTLSMFHNLSLFDDTHNQNLENPNLNPFMIQECGDLDASKTTLHDGGGGHKKRKSEELLSIETSNTEDNYAWRKYGQKAIQQSDHPRSYYKCTHKSDKGCQATKHVQQISENPAKYKVVYRGRHTCNINPLNNPASLLDLIDEQDNYNNPPNFLCFKKPTKHGALNPKFILFPSSSSSSHMGNATVEREYVFPKKNETPSASLNIQYCPSSSSSSSSSDLTTITPGHSSAPGSHEAVLLVEDYSSAATTHSLLDVEDYNIMSDTVDFSDMFQDYFDLFPWS